MVYAIVGARGASSMRSRSGQRLRVVRSGSMAAVVGRVRCAPAPTAANLRRYDRTMRQLAERYPALLPARFGTVMNDVELLFVLSSRGPALSRALAAVRNKAQMTVRLVRRNETARQKPAPVPSRAAPSSSSGRDYLLARARAAAAERTVPEFEPLRSAVVRWVRGERVEQKGSVSTVYHLIPRSSTERYRKALEQAAAVRNVRAIVSGPWPPYAFTTPE
jgi:hypothetical protein